jgi:dethiobiotin synthetase/adenosylmethionine--8-amino-7-oxononanoate aminotransferase
MPFKIRDPLFQRVLIDTVRENPQFFSGNDKPSSSTSWSGLPVIFDEVFTGIYRLGRRTASSFLGVHPDIVVNAKLLTGGLIPMSTTMASEEIFQAFEGPEKSDALLHGHSYTAHPIGCSVAGYSVRRMIEMAEQGAWSGFVSDWKREKDEQQGGPEVWSWWSRSLVTDLSFARPVESVFALGSLLGITLRDQAGTGGKTFENQLSLLSSVADSALQDTLPPRRPVYNRR